MRLAVVVRARSYLRTLGPIISAAIRRDWFVLVYVPPTKLKSREDQIQPDEMERFWPGATVTHDADVFRIVPQAVIGLNQGMAGVATAARVLLVDPACDCWLTRPTREQTYASEWHRTVHGWLHDGQFFGKPLITGWVNGDWAFPRSLDLSRDKLAVFFSLKLHVPGRARWGWDGMRAYRKAAEQARDVARAHGWTFVVKGRDKHGDPRWLKNLGEYVTDDAHPYESLRLLSRAAWCIHYAPSGVGREAALLGVPQTALRVATPHLDHLPGHAERMSMLAPVDGVISTRLMPFEIDQVARQAWVSKYLGVQDGRCAERVLDAL